MLITGIRYGRTINLGNYESEKLEVECIPESGQTAEAALDELQKYVESKCSKTAEPKKPARSLVNLKTGGTAAAGDKPALTSPPLSTSDDHSLWARADWDNYVAPLESAGVLTLFKAEILNKAVYDNLQLWQQACEAFADQARRTMGPDDPNRTEMVALLNAERDRINNPQPAKPKRAPRKPKAS
jgi:hypothetical protein